jgi:biopolymer transport protein ExbD
MAMSVGPSGDGDEEAALNSSINTTPLVDVMLVLLIIFLITIPAITHNVPLTLPKETNQARQTKPENVNLSVNREGDVFWDTKPVADMDALVEKLKTVSVKTPQPEVQIRGDLDVRYEFVGKVIFACERAGIQKVSFIVEPPVKG